MMVHTRKPGSEPPAIYKMSEGQLWRMLPAMDEDWIDLGVAPKPCSAREGFLHHIFHGMLMRYSIVDIVFFAWRYRASFIETPELTEVITSETNVKATANNKYD